MISVPDARNNCFNTLNYTFAINKSSAPLSAVFRAQWFWVSHLQSSAYKILSFSTPPSFRTRIKPKWVKSKICIKNLATSKQSWAELISEGLSTLCKLYLSRSQKSIEKTWNDLWKTTFLCLKDELQKKKREVLIPKTKVMERLTALWGTHAKLGILTKIGRFLAFGFSFLWFFCFARLVNF